DASGGSTTVPRRTTRCSSAGCHRRSSPTWRNPRLGRASRVGAVGAQPIAGPIAVAGMHRTGTSMVTKVLHDAGLALVGSDAEDLIDPADDNPEGFWENKA